MLRKCLLMCFGALLIGCQQREKNIAYEKVNYQLLNDSIMTRMPGDLIVADNYLVWEDPFARDYFVNVHDIVTGKEIGKMGKVGEGPAEFVTGGINSFCINKKFFATDLNGKTRGFLSLDSLLDRKDCFVPLTDKEKSERPEMKELQNNVFVGISEDGNTDYFNAIINGKKITFGAYPVKEVREHVGNDLAYDSISGLLACCSFRIPYLALYKRDGYTFNMQWELEPDGGYEVSDGRLILDDRVGGILDIALGKDYIICLQRDWKREPLDKSVSGRDVRALPHTVFLYDYDSRLLKVVDLGMPVVRIAADRRSNTLYAFGLNPEYILVKYEL